jgi:hypothetical protein
MTAARVLAYCAVVAASASVAGAQGRPLRAEVDAAFKQWWAAPDPEAARDAADRVVQSGVSFADAFRRLRAGRVYARNVPTGVVLDSRRADGEEFFYSLDVPPNYVPSRRYHVRVQLHGGVGAGEDNRRRGTGAIGEMAGPVDGEQIYIIPTSWLDVPWWSDKQLRNIRAILDRVKRVYNVDENRVVVSGVSDGGTASYYVAMRDATPYASFLPLIGSLMQLAARTFNLDDLYPNNLENKPFFVVNTLRDVLYPSRAIDPVIWNLHRAGVTVDYRPRDGVHDTSWWPDVREDFERFVREHPRVPYPDRLTWQIGRDDPFNRAHWLVIDELTTAPSTPLQPDVNEIPTPRALTFGVLSSGSTITRVVPDSDAARIGLKNRDVLLEVNGTPIGSDAELDAVLDTCCRQPAALALTVARGGERISLTGTLTGSSQYGPTVPMFPRRRPNGRVDLVKSGNTVRATTSGVRAFTLLVSPDAFDLRRPITVEINGKTVTYERVVPNVATLLKWAAVDNDRTMLFAAEIRVTVAD